MPPKSILLALEKSDSSPWSFGDKIELLTNPVTSYRFRGKERLKYRFLREDLFFDLIQNRKRPRPKDQESIDLCNLVDEYKVKMGCNKCSYKEHPKALGFDHLVPETKESSISDLVGQFIRSGKAKREILRQKIQEEAAKCVVICQNCHSIKSHKEKCGQNKLKTNYVAVEDYMSQNNKNNKTHLQIEPPK